MQLLTHDLNLSNSWENKVNNDPSGRKMSVIEGIRKKAKRELEFQLHAFETKGRFELNSFDKKEIFSSSVHLLKSPRRKCIQTLLISF